MKLQIDLKPCPFCGSAAEYGEHHKSVYVFCTGCGAMTKCFAENNYKELNQLSAAESWNRRKENG